MIIRSANQTHNATVASAESMRQAAVTAASNQAAVIAAEIIFYRACLASALANNCETSAFSQALMSLGTR